MIANETPSDPVQKLFEASDTGSFYIMSRAWQEFKKDCDRGIKKQAFSKTLKAVFHASGIYVIFSFLFCVVFAILLLHFHLTVLESGLFSLIFSSVLTPVLLLDAFMDAWNDMLLLLAVERFNEIKGNAHGTS
jgi:hypothetical protein